MANMIKIKCENCENFFEVRKGKEKRTCSTKCRWELRAKNDEKYYIIKKCEVCDNEFKSKIKEKKKYCSYKCSGIAKKIKSREFRVCKICGNKFEERKKYKRNFCSEQCRLNWQSLLENKKSRINKSKQMLIKNHGVDSIFKIKGIQKKIQEKIRFQYLINGDDIINKIKETKKNKYDDGNYNNHNKISETKLNKYGNENYNNRKKFKLTINEKLKNRLNDINYKLINVSSDNIITIQHSDGHIFKTPRSLLLVRLNENREISTKYLPHSPNISNYELEIAKFLDELNVNYVASNKKIISPYELDFYLPDHKLAIEFNGLYWHSEYYKSNDYHLNKTELCKKQGIQLLHVFEDEWVNKKEIIKSLLRYKFGLIKNKVYGRKCVIKEINNDEYQKFLINNHILGKTKSSIKLGLFYNKSLVSVIGFKKQKNNELNLNRYCTLINHNVLGGASKLLKYVINKYDPNIIITFADRRYSEGNLYNKIGFNLVKIIKPNYWYCDFRNIIRIHRFNFRKNKLNGDGLNLNKTEHEIMLSRKIPRIYDCGLLKYEIKKTPYSI